MTADLQDAPGTNAEDSTEDNSANDTNKTFTQAELDTIVKDRLAREQKKYSDYNELKKFKQQQEQAAKAQMTEVERQVAEAKELGKKEAATEFSVQIAAAEVRAALTGLTDDVDSIIEDLNMNKFVTEDGSVNKEAIAALKKKYTELVGNKKPGDVGHGRRTNPLTPASPKEALGKFLGITG